MQGVPHVFCFRRNSLCDGEDAGTPCITVRVLSKEASHELPTVPETRAARLRKLFLATLYPVGGRFCTADFPDTKRKRSLTFVSDLGAPEETRTPDLLIRSQTLYPAELPALVHRVCRGTYIIIPPTLPNVKHFFKVFSKIRKKSRFRRSYVILFLSGRRTAGFYLRFCAKHRIL